MQWEHDLTEIKIIKKLIVLSVFFCSPLILLATRGSEDYGIVFALMAILFSVPVGIMLFGFIIYLIVILNSKKKPEIKQGRIVFILSIITIFLSLIIPLFWIYWADKHYDMFVLMSGAFVPIIILAAISIVLAKFIKKRALKIDNNMVNDNYEIEHSNALNKRISRKFIWFILLIIVITIIVLVKYFFVG